MLVDNKFIAALSSGAQIERPDFRGMAQALYCAGVVATNVSYEWRAGQRMITAGQQVALRAELGRLERESAGVAATA
jgi:hypothetical protein